MNPALISSPGLVGFLEMLFAFAMFHSLGDFALQNSFISQAKSRKADLSSFFSKSPPKGIWIHVLTAHALIHAGGVWLVSGSSLLAVTEFVLHWIIDFWKSETSGSFHLDQFLHLSCKVAYTIYLLKP